VLWLIASLAFRFYVVNFGSYEESYGTLGAIILLMLWFYLTGLAIIIGAELNAELEHASPWGKKPGEKVPGQKRKIGAAAARAYHALRHSHAVTIHKPEPRRVPAAQRRTVGGMLIRIGILAAAVVRLRRDSAAEPTNRAPSE
jgi:membrane protein